MKRGDNGCSLRASRRYLRGWVGGEATSSLSLVTDFSIGFFAGGRGGTIDLGKLNSREGVITTDGNYGDDCLEILC